MSTPPQSQDNSPVSKPAFSCNITRRPSYSVSNFERPGAIYLADNDGEPPTPVDTPNKSFDLGGDYPEDASNDGIQPGNNMLLASLMQDISSMSSDGIPFPTAPVASKFSSASQQGYHRNYPGPVVDLSGSSGFHRRHSLPTSLLGVEGSANYRNGLTSGQPPNARLSRIPEFRPNGDATRRTEPFVPTFPGPQFNAPANPWKVSYAPSTKPSQCPVFLSNNMIYSHQAVGLQTQPIPNHRSNYESMSGNLTCYLVQFTCGRTDTYYIPHEMVSLEIKIGDYIVVEADRGEDLGRVIMDNINVPLPRRNSSASINVHGNSPVFGGDPYLYQQGCFDDQCVQMPSAGTHNGLPKKIYRKAAMSEIESLLAKVRDEINAVAVGQFKVQEWKLPMSIIDAEYQWDRRKLTFFFSVTLPQFYPNQPAPRIDFRTLVRDLYQIYRTRIWMFCVDKDKNRLCRSHNREKFYKQLYEDTKPLSQSSLAVGAELNGSPEHGNIYRQQNYLNEGFDSKSARNSGNSNWDVQDMFRGNFNEYAIDEISSEFANTMLGPGPKGTNNNWPLRVVSPPFCNKNPVEQQNHNFPLSNDLLSEKNISYSEYGVTQI